MKRAIIYILLSINAASQGQTLPKNILLPAEVPVIKKIDPASVSAKDSSNESFTIFGSNLENITAARFTLNGAASNLKATLQKSSSEMRPVTVFIPKGTKPNTFVLELEYQNTWHQASCKLKVYNNKTINKATKPPVTTITYKPEQYQDILNAIKSTKYIAQSPFDKLQITTQQKAVSDLQKAIKDATLEITDWYPRDTGALGGTIVFVGHNINQLLQVKLAGQILPEVKRTKDTLVLRFPETFSNERSALEIGYNVGLIVRSEPSKFDVMAQHYVLLDQRRLHARGTVLSVAGNTSPEGACYAGCNYSLLIQVDHLVGETVSIVELFSNQLDIDCSQTYFEGGDFSRYRCEGYARSSSGIDPVCYGNRRLLRIKCKPTPYYSVDKNNFHSATTVTFEIIGIHAKGPGIADEVICDMQFNLTVKPRHLYTISNTNDLSEILGFTRTSAWGQTDGKSMNGYALGQISLGGDLAFRVVSGVVGTEGIWRSNYVSIHDDWEVVSMNWEQTQEGPKDLAGRTVPVKAAVYAPQCCLDPAGDNCVLGSIFGQEGGALNYLTGCCSDGLARVNSTDGDGCIMIVPYITPDMQPLTVTHHMLRSVIVDLRACQTLFDDHRVTSRLNSVTIYGPENGDWHNAFGESTPYSTAVGIDENGYPTFYYENCNGHYW